MEENDELHVAPKVDTNFTAANGGVDAAVRPRDEHQDTKMPAAKKRRTVNGERRSILFDCGEEIVRHVYSFLSLKEALVLRQTCCRLNTGTNAYRYSQLSSPYYGPRRIPYPMGFTSGSETISVYWDQQSKVLANLGHNDKLRATLLNASLTAHHKQCLLDNVVKYSETDNGEAVSILLKEKEIDGDIYMLDIALKKDYTAMAAALQQDDTIKAGMRMCFHCSVNIGCYYCSNDEYNCPIKFSLNDLPKFCRPCALANGKMCVECEEILSPGCCQQEEYYSTVDGRIYCVECCNECNP